MAYQSIFESMNRKDKRKFNSLPEDEKAEIFRTELQKTISGKMADEVTNSFYRGYLMAYSLLYENYIEPMLKLDESEYEKVVKIWAALGKEIAEKNEKAHAEFAIMDKKSEGKEGDN